MTTFGWVGRGAASSALAEILSGAGLDLVDTDALAGYEHEGAVVLVTCFADHAELEPTLTSLAVEEWPEGSVWLDLGITPVTVTRQLATMMAARGISSVDAPFTGFIERARSGSYRFMVGRVDDQSIETVSPLLERLGVVQVVGKPGAGQSVHMCDRVLAATMFLAQSESRVIAHRCGLDDRVFRSATADGSSNQLLNHPIESQLPVNDTSHGRNFTSIHDLERVLQIAAMTGVKLRAPAPIATQTWKMYQVALRQGLGDHHAGDVLQVVVDRAGLNLDEFSQPSLTRPERPTPGDADGRVVGLIGLGTIGGLVADGLIDGGYRVIAYDLRPTWKDKIIESGGIWADSAQDVTSQAQITLASLPGPDEVEACVLGENGALEGMSAGSIFVDMTTSDPELTRRLARLAAERGAVIVDAAVSRGGPLGGAAGNFALWVGCSEGQYPELDRVLNLIGNMNTYCNDTGLGQAVKVCNNYVSQVADAIAGEMFVLAQACGVDPFTLYDAIWPQGDGASLFGRRWPQCALVGNWTPRLRLVLGRKDLGLGIELARRASVALSVGPLAYETFSEALARGYGDLDRSAIVLVQEATAGVKVVSETSVPARA